MSDQPEALFLADVIENDPQSKAHHDAAAAELRRLHAECGALRARAERYRLLRRGQQWSVIDGGGNTLRAETLDTAIDAARAALKEAK